MNNWGGRKQVLGEVDVFKVMPDYELYGRANVNYWLCAVCLFRGQQGFWEC